MRPAPAPWRRPTTTRPAEHYSDDTTGAELAAVRSQFAAIEGGIMTTAPPATLRGLLATMRAQQRATEAEIIERGRRRHAQRQDFARAAQGVAAKAARPPRPLPRRLAFTRPRGVP